MIDASSDTEYVWSIHTAPVFIGTVREAADWAHLWGVPDGFMKIEALAGGAPA